MEIVFIRGLFSFSMLQKQGW